MLASLPSDRRGPLDRNGPLDLPNLLSYALGIAPLAAQPSDLPVAVIESQDGDQYLTFVFRKNPAAADVVYIPEISTSLQPTSWASGTDHLSVIENTPVLMKVSSKTALGAATRQFIRLRVELNVSP
jgi:hypothetical protein